MIWLKKMQPDARTPNYSQTKCLHELCGCWGGGRPDGTRTVRRNSHLTTQVSLQHSLEKLFQKPIPIFLAPKESSNFKKYSIFLEVPDISNAAVHFVCLCTFQFSAAPFSIERPLRTKHNSQVFTPWQVIFQLSQEFVFSEQAIRTAAQSLAMFDEG